MREDTLMIKCMIDSSADLSPETALSYNIDVLPIPISIDDNTYLDGINLNPSELSNLLGAFGHSIQTHHISPSVYEDSFLPYAAKGDSVICLCSGKELTGNYLSAQIAALSIKEIYPNFDITILDSKSASCGYGLIAIKIASLVQKNITKPELLEAAHFYINHVQHYFFVPVMSYFMKGGKISHAIGSIGDTLDVHSLFTISSDGEILKLNSIPAKGTQHAIQTFVQRLKNSGTDFSTQTMMFCCGKDIKNLNYFVNQSNETLHPKEIKISTIGCAVAAHAGSSLIGVSYFDKTNPFLL